MTELASMWWQTLGGCSVERTASSSRRTLCCLWTCNLRLGQASEKSYYTGPVLTELISKSLQLCE